MFFQKKKRKKEKEKLAGGLKTTRNQQPATFLENEKTFPKTLIKRNSQRVPPAIYCRLLVELQMRNCDDIWSQSEKLNRKSVTKNRETSCGHKLYFQFKNL